MPDFLECAGLEEACSFTMTLIEIGIAGYGNLGRGVEAALGKCDDMRLAGVFSRRAGSLKTDSGAGVFGLDQIEGFRGKVDVMILCGGSKSDLPQQGPELAGLFSTVDSFDTHGKIPEYFAEMDSAARSGGNVAVISVGWDPGLFSLMRVFGESVLPAGHTATFWGPGVSQGHSDAIRRIPGVKSAVQYTVPVETAVDRVRRNERDGLTKRECHRRDCFVVLEKGADASEVKQAIVTMPDYFADYDTTVEFLSAEKFAAEHGAMPHGGFVIRSGESGGGAKQMMEFRLSLESNPQFTAGVLVAYARAAYRLKECGESGARTVFDIAPGLLMPKGPDDLRREWL